MSIDIRWKQRFENLEKAFCLLQEVIENNQIDKLSSLEKEGLVQRFIFVLELTWKTLKDKMQHDGLVIDKISPKYVFKLAYQKHYITDINIWLEMIADRNSMSHNYNEANFENLLKSLHIKYYPKLKYFVENIK